MSLIASCNFIGSMLITCWDGYSRSMQRQKGTKVSALQAPDPLRERRAGGARYSV